MNKFLLAALLAGVSTVAFASDLPSKKAPPSLPPVYAAPIFTWTGAYVGLNGGVGIGSLSNSNFAATNGAVFGGQIGYNYQLGQFVGGVEADLDDTFASRKGTYTNVLGAGTNKFSTGLMTTERLRAGYAIDRTLLFVTGGYAGIDTTASYANVLGAPAGQQSVWRSGGVVGFGAEYAFTNNISFKAEYLYAPFSSASYFGGTEAAEKDNFSMNVVRAGLNFHF